MYQEPEDFRSRLASSTFYHVLNVDPRSPVRLPQSMGPATLPGKNGEDLVTAEGGGVLVRAGPIMAGDFDGFVFGLEIEVD